MPYETITDENGDEIRVYKRPEPSVGVEVLEPENEEPSVEERYWGNIRQPSKNGYVPDLVDGADVRKRYKIKTNEDGSLATGEDGKLIWEERRPGVSDRPDYDKNLASGRHFLSNTFGGQLVAPFVEPVIAGTKELVQSGDIEQSLAAAGQASDEALGVKGQEVTKEGRAVVPTVYRLSASAMRNTLQELNDRFLYDIPAKIADNPSRATTFIEPDAPFLGTQPLPSLPTSGPVEDLITGLVQAGIQLRLLSKLGIPTIPGTKDLVTAPLKGQPGQGLLKRGTGLYLEGIEYGAIIDGLGFDQHSGRLADLLNHFGLNITPQLLTDPNDVGLDGSFKNIADGIIYGGPLGAAIGGSGQLGKAGIKNAPRTAEGWSNLLAKVFKVTKANQDVKTSIDIEKGEIKTLPEGYKALTKEEAVIKREEANQEFDAAVEEIKEIDEINQVNNAKEAELKAKLKSLISQEPQLPKPPEGGGRYWTTDTRTGESILEGEEIPIEIREAYENQLNVYNKAINKWDQEVDRLAKEIKGFDTEQTVKVSGKIVGDNTIQPPKELDLTTDTRGKGEFYHGAADEIELTEAGEFSTDQNIYGIGFYTTDDLVTAGKYQRKNRKIVGKDAQKTIYKIKEKTPIKFYDLDQPVPDDLKEFIKSYDDEFAYNIVAESVDSLGDNYTLGQLYDEIRGYANANDVSSSVVSYEIFPDFEAYLKNQGFGGFIHQGGKKAGKGKRLHQVRIYWDPYNSINIEKVNVSETPLVKPNRKPTDEMTVVENIQGSSLSYPDSPKIGTKIPRGETAQSGAVFIERVDKGTGQTGPMAKVFNLPNTYDLAILELKELNTTQLAELGIKKADIAKLTPRKTINLLKKNFDNVRKDLLPGEYRMEGYSESRRKLYKKWFKDDPNVEWVDRQTGANSKIEDEMSIPYLIVKGNTNNQAPVQPQVLPPFPEINPLVIAQKITDNLDDIKSGKVKLDDLLENDLLRLISRKRPEVPGSGKKRYEPRPTPEFVAGLRGLSDALVNVGSKAQRTGLPTLDFKDMRRMVFRDLREQGITAKQIDQILPRLRPLQEVNQQNARVISDLMALNQVVRILGKESGIYANQWKNHRTGIAIAADEKELLQDGISVINEFMKGAQAYETVGRGDSQRLASRQINGTVTFGNASVLADTIQLFHPADGKLYKNVIEKGFKLTPASKNTLVGEGVYFKSTNENVGTQPLSGDTLSNKDSQIFDYQSAGFHIGEITEKAGLGYLGTAAGHPKLTIEQQGLLREYLIDQGFTGIRFADQETVVIFNVEEANKIVGSKVAPESLSPSRSVIDEINNTMEKGKQLINDLSDPQIKAELDSDAPLSESTRQWADATFNSFANYRSEDFAAHVDFAKSISKANMYSLTRDMMLSYYSGSLLFSPSTMTTMVLGGAYKSATLPIDIALGAYIHGLGTYAKGIVQGSDATIKRARRIIRRGNKSWQLYNQYRAEHNAGLELARMAFDDGVSYNSSNRSYVEHIKESMDNDGVLRLGQEQGSAPKPITKKVGSMTFAMRESTLDNPGVLDPNNKNWLATALRFIWKTNNMSLKGAMSIDTYFGTIVGKASEFNRLYLEELEKAEDLGYKWDSLEIADYATKNAAERLRDISQDVLKKDGSIMKDGILKSETAKNVTNWVNYTYDLWATPEARTLVGGERLARDKGITDPKEIEEFASNWASEQTEIPRISRGIAGIGNAWQKAITHSPELRLLQMFNRAPVNVIKDVQRGSPLFWADDNFWKNINSEDPQTRYRTTGEVAKGTLIASIGIGLMQTGLFKCYGPGPLNPIDNKNWREVNRIPGPFSCKMRNPATGDWFPAVSLERLDQIGIILGFLGEYYELAPQVSDDQAQSLASATVIGIANATVTTGGGVIDKAMFQGWSSLKKILTGLAMPVDPTGDRINPAARWVQDTAAKMIIPYGGMLRLSRKGFDNQVRSIPASNPLNETFNRIKNQLTGYSEELPNRLESVGARPQTYAKSLFAPLFPKESAWLTNALDPGNAFPYKSSSPVHDVLASLDRRGKSFRFFPANTFSSKYGDKYLLTYEQQNLLKRIGNEVIPKGYSNTFERTLEDEFTNPKSRFNQLSRELGSGTRKDSAAAEYVRTIYNAYITEAKKVFLQFPENAIWAAEFELIDNRNKKIRNSLDPKSTIRSFEGSINY
jgi:hypothetical protein